MEFHTDLESLGKVDVDDSFRRVLGFIERGHESIVDLPLGTLAEFSNTALFEKRLMLNQAGRHAPHLVAESIRYLIHNVIRVADRRRSELLTPKSFIQYRLLNHIPGPEDTYVDLFTGWHRDPRTPVVTCSFDDGVASTEGLEGVLSITDLPEPYRHILPENLEGELFPLQGDAAEPFVVSVIEEALRNGKLRKKELENGEVGLLGRRSIHKRGKIRKAGTRHLLSIFAS